MQDPQFLSRHQDLSQLYLQISACKVIDLLGKFPDCVYHSEESGQIPDGNDGKE